MELRLDRFAARRAGGTRSRAVRTVFVLALGIASLAPTGARADERETPEASLPVSAAPIEGAAERAIVDRVSEMIGQLLDLEGNGASLRVSGAMRAETDGAALRITYPRAVLWSAGTPVIRLGDTTLAVTALSERIFDFVWPLPARLQSGDSSDSTLTLGAGTIEGRWDSVARLPKRLVVSLRDAVFSERDGAPSEIAIPTFELRFEQSESGAWSGTFDLAVDSIDLDALLPAREGQKFAVERFSLHLAGREIDFAAWRAATGEAAAAESGGGGLGRLSLLADADGVSIYDPNGSSFEAKRVDWRADVDFASEPGRLDVAMKHGGVSWSRIPGLPLPEKLLPRDLALEFALESIPVKALLPLMAENSAPPEDDYWEEGEGDDWSEEGEGDGWSDTAAPEAPPEAGADPLAVLNEAGTVLKLRRLRVGREEAQLSAEGTLRFAPSTAPTPVFGTINAEIEGLDGFIGAAVRAAAQAEDPASIDLALAFLVILEGFGERAEGGDGAPYSYEYVISEGGEFRINGIPFDPGRLDRQRRQSESGASR